MVRASTGYVLYERDESGAAFAVEVVEADRWDGALLDPPRPERADARIVRLRDGEPPDDLPRWLSVEAGGVEAGGVEAGGAGVAVETAGGLRESSSEYTPGSGGGHSAEAATRSVAQGLWPWSPYHRRLAASFDEFIAAGAAALRHPRPVPAERRRQCALISAFAEGRPSPIAELATLNGEALERWLALAFADPDAFADALLLERIEAEGDAETAALLRFLREAEVPAEAHAHTELAVDRRVLLEQASPWRYVEAGGSFESAVAAVRAWMRRYRSAYDEHYRAMVLRAEEVRAALALAAPAAAALQQLDGIRSLGPPVGEGALERHRAAEAALVVLPAEPDGEAARTAGVTLGREPAACAEARSASNAVRRALDVQRGRLASETVRLVLSHPGVPALERLLQAIAVSDVDAIERVLDDALAAHIEALLEQASRSPLAELVQRYPQVTASNAGEVVETFSSLLQRALDASQDGRVSLD